MPVADETLDRFIDVLAVTASFGWAFGDLLDEASRLPLPSSADHRLVIERGLENGRFVAEPSCATPAWEGERVSLSLEDCALGSSGRSARGTVTLEVSAGALRLGLEGLVVRETVLHGAITLRSDVSAPPVTRHVGGVVRYEDADAPTTLTFAGVVQFSAFTPLREPGATPVLTGTWAGGGRASELFVQATWVPGDCLPSDGYALFRGAPFAYETRLGFGPSTLDDHRWGANTLSCR